MAVSVDEASRTYERGMRNIAARGPGICPTCRTFIEPNSYPNCFPCGHQPSNLSAVVPITYSEGLGQIHTALRGYKDRGTASTQRQQMIRLAAILWRFLREHEDCVAREAGVERFEIATVVPSSTRERDHARPNFRTLVGWIGVLESRREPLLRPSADATMGRYYAADRYEATRALDDENVLLLDDTWTSGAHSQSAAATLLAAGAGNVALVVIGRHVNRDHAVGDETCGDRLDALPETFDWDTCAVH